MDRDRESRSTRQTRFSLSQETITILTVGVALAGIILVNHGEMRAEARAARAESRAEREAMRAEARADRQAFADRITRLVEQQGTLTGSSRASSTPSPRQGNESRVRPSL